MRLVFATLLVLLTALSHAIVVGPAIYEQGDFGDVSLHTFTYSISADCTAGAITTIIMDERLERVKDANAYLKYIDFSSPLIGSATSDKDGYVLHKLPGDVKLMRGLFILVIEKKGYRMKEMHFDLYPCTHNGTMPPMPPLKNPSLPKPQPTQNVTKPPPVKNSSISVPAANITNTSGNATGTNSQADGFTIGGYSCPTVFVLLASILLSIKSSRGGHEAPRLCHRGGIAYSSRLCGPRAGSVKRHRRPAT